MKKVKLITLAFGLLLGLVQIKQTEQVAAMDDAYYSGEVEDETVDENLELPDIYENTLIYNGTINPELNFGIHFPGSETPERPYVNEAGQFSASLAMEELQAGDEITLRFGEDAMEPNNRTIEVLPAEEGMEIVESNADTSNVQNSVLESTSYEWHDGEEAIDLQVNAVGDMGGSPFYSVNNEPITEENRLEHINDNLYRVLLSERSIAIGDTVTVYIVASGVTTPLEVEVPDTLESLQQAEGTETEEEPEGTEDTDEATESEDDEDSEEDVGTRI